MPSDSITLDKDITQFPARKPFDQLAVIFRPVRPAQAVLADRRVHGGGPRIRARRVGADRYLYRPAYRVYKITQYIFGRVDLLPVDLEQVIALADIDTGLVERGVERAVRGGKRGRTVYLLKAIMPVGDLVVGPEQPYPVASPHRRDGVTASYTEMADGNIPEHLRHQPVQV